jgi:hypothetical protein
MGGREGGRGISDDVDTEEEEEEELLVLRLLLLLPVLLLQPPVEFEFSATRSSIFFKRSALLSADVPLTMVRPSRVVSRRYSVMILGGRGGEEERKGGRERTCEEVYMKIL